MTRLRTAVLTSLVSVVGLLHLGGCAVEATDEDLDPTTTLGAELPTDEGPTPAEEASDAAVQTTELFRATDSFQVPFPCGQVWAGSTFTGHNPQNSVDFNRLNDFGDTVVASKAGTVTRVANEGNTSYGRWVEVAHGDGYTTRYAHLSLQSVHVGQHVAQGQKLGEVGSTGGSTGPHLHFEERRNGIALRETFAGIGALYFGTRNYTSQNTCGGGGGGGTTGSTSWVGRVNTAGVDLTTRAGASTSTTATGSVGDGATVHITCQTHGQSIRGTYGTSTLWDKIGAGKFVADAYVSTGSDGQVAPNCP